MPAIVGTDWSGFVVESLEEGVVVVIVVVHDCHKYVIKLSLPSSNVVAG